MSTTPLLAGHGDASATLGNDKRSEEDSGSANPAKKPGQGSSDAPASVVHSKKPPVGPKKPEQDSPCKMPADASGGKNDNGDTLADAVVKTEREVSDTPVAKIRNAKKLVKSKTGMSTTPLLAEHGDASATLGNDKRPEEDSGSANLAKKPGQGSSDASASDVHSKKPPVGPKKLEQFSSEESPCSDTLVAKIRNAFGKASDGKDPGQCRADSADCSVVKELNADTLADAAAKLSQELKNPVVVRICKVFAGRARKFAANPKDLNVRAGLLEAGRFLDLVAKDTPEAEDVRDVLQATDFVLARNYIPESVLVAYDMQRRIAEPNLRRLRYQARNFCNLAATSSMADAAVDFDCALEEHASGKDRGKKVAETRLQKASMRLFHAANEAPPDEFPLAERALKLTNDAGIILLEQNDCMSTAGAALRSLTGRFCSGCCPSPRCDCLQCCSVCWPSLMKWIRGGPELTLPVHHKLQSKLVDKRQVIYAIALGTPLALLTSAASLNIFPSAYAPWIAGATVGIWVIVSAGMLANLYGTTHLELMAASNLSRLGMIGVCVLLCVYAFWAFFPSHLNILSILLACVVIFHGGLCILSRVRGDDDTLAMIQMAEQGGDYHPLPAENR